MTPDEIENGTVREGEIYICHKEGAFDPKDVEDRVCGPIRIHVKCDKTLRPHFVQVAWDDLKDHFEDEGERPDPAGGGTFWQWNVKNTDNIYKGSTPP